MQGIYKLTVGVIQKLGRHGEPAGSLGAGHPTLDAALVTATGMTLATSESVPAVQILAR